MNIRANSRLSLGSVGYGDHDDDGACLRPTQPTTTAARSPWFLSARKSTKKNLRNDPVEEDRYWVTKTLGTVRGTPTTNGDKLLR